MIDGRLNDAFKAMNLLFDKNVALRRVDATGDGLRRRRLPRPGRPRPEAVLAEVAKATGVDFNPLKAEPKAAHELKRMRIGMYQRYRGGNMDEGWTRWIFEQFAFQFKSVYDAEIKKGDLNANYDVFIFADDSTGTITGDPAARRGGGEGGGGRFDGVPDTTPPEYRSGIGTDGVDAIKDFVQKGGTLVTLGGATDFAITRLGLPVRNVVEGLSPKEFFCPGSTLRVAIDNTNPLAYGMPAQGLVLFHYSPAFDVVATEFNDRNDIVVRYADRNVERSGWLNGEKYIAGKTAMASIGYGQGTRGADRVPDAEPRPDARHLQVPVQRARDATGAGRQVGPQELGTLRRLSRGLTMQHAGFSPRAGRREARAKRAGIRMPGWPLRATPGR